MCASEGASLRARLSPLWRFVFLFSSLLFYLRGFCPATHPALQVQVAERSPAHRALVDVRAALGTVAAFGQYIWQELPTLVFPQPQLNPKHAEQLFPHPQRSLHSLDWNVVAVVRVEPSQRTYLTMCVGRSVPSDCKHGSA